MVKIDIRMLYPPLEPFYIGWILLFMTLIPEMRVAGDDFVKSEYHAFDVVSAFYASNTTDPATIVEVEQHNGVCPRADEKIPGSDILVGDAVLEIQIVYHASQLPEPVQLKRTGAVLVYRAARDIEACEADNTAM
jgi:hypothetical protein